jgi:hypothetical protein
VASSFATLSSACATETLIKFIKTALNHAHRFMSVTLPGPFFKQSDLHANHGLFLRDLFLSAARGINLCDLQDNR